MRSNARQRTILLTEWGNACQRCGYNRCARALQFHHKDPSDKLTDGSRGNASLKAVKAHPERFELLCANCHFEEHDAIDRSRIAYQPCRYCGEPVRIEPRRLADGKGKYCSKKCEIADRPNVAKTEAERFWRHVEKTDTCWLWTASKTKQGYGQFNPDTGSNLAHRTAWRLHYGSIPYKRRIVQTCGNRACVRPDPLNFKTK